VVKKHTIKLLLLKAIINDNAFKVDVLLFFHLVKEFQPGENHFTSSSRCIFLLNVYSMVAPFLVELEDAQEV
jgi:hypothetical protein